MLCMHAETVVKTKLIYKTCMIDYTELGSDTLNCSGAAATYSILKNVVALSRHIFKSSGAATTRKQNSTASFALLFK